MLNEDAARERLGWLTGGVRKARKDPIIWRYPIKRIKVSSTSAFFWISKRSNMFN